MPTFLLAWNPKLFPGGSLLEELASVRPPGTGVDRWSTGSRQIRPGDRLFLIRLGDPLRGIVGSGWAVDEPLEAPHWDPERAAGGVLEWYVPLVIDRLLQEPAVSWEELHQGPFSGFRWGIPRSGVRIPPETAEALEGAWAKAFGGRNPWFPGEVEQGVEIREGGQKTVWVNRYERNPRARALAIAAHGLRCSVCDMSFLERYGEAAASYIQVHHQIPVSSRGGEYVLDPVKDLRPVCPNCHAVIHTQDPPYSLEEVRSMMKTISPSQARRTPHDLV